jgi:hypothetical protein
MRGLLSTGILILDIIAIVDIIKSSKVTTQKITWIIIVLFLPVLGVVVYYAMGRQE